MNRIGNFASILGLIITVIQFMAENPNNSINAVLIILFFTIFVIFWIQHNSVKHYVNAQMKLQDIHYEIIGDYEKFKNYNLEKSIHELSIVCQEIATTLSKLRHCNVSVCIKYTNRKDDIYYVKTLCRDPLSYHERRNLYVSQDLDIIDKNTDFREIFEKIANKTAWNDIYFFANYLPFKFQYENTHLDTKLLPNNFLLFFTRNRKWSLCYKSTIVVPILSDNNRDIYGYICVDSAKNKGFNRKKDIRLMQNIALFLAPTIRLVSERHLKTRRE